MANTHQGKFPVHDTGEDGYIGISSVAQFPANGYGLYDMAGNVWQWTSDWYRPDYYQQLAAQGVVARNPQGPNSSSDPSEPNQAKKVHRGGSFLCTDQYCSRYIVGTRGKGEPDTGTNHLGFRCVMTAAQYQRQAGRS
jgi:sulfatase modifying factor 1